MAKFIIEVSDDFICKMTKLEAYKKKENKERDSMVILYDMLGYTGINKKIEEGEKEFHISQDDCSKDWHLKMFNTALPYLFNAILCMDKENHEEEEE